MESRNVYTEPMSQRLKRAFGFLFNHIQSAPDHRSDHYRPSAQRDVGKSARAAAGVQLVIGGLEAVPKIERTELAQVELAERLMKTELNRWDSLGNYMDDDFPPEAA